MKPYIYIYVCMYIDMYVYIAFTNYHQLNYNSWDRLGKKTILQNSICFVFQKCLREEELVNNKMIS